jgi:hypothetical protein
LFRPPYGKITRKQAKELLPHYQIVMWDRLSVDYKKDLNIEESLRQMKRVNKGSILVFHDSEKAFENLQKLLPVLLADYQKRGYQLNALAYK